jgi:hypothetical protein
MEVSSVSAATMGASELAVEHQGGAEGGATCEGGRRRAAVAGECERRRRALEVGESFIKKSREKNCNFGFPNIFAILPFLTSCL